MKIDKMFKLKTIRCIYRWNRQSKFRKMLGNHKAILENQNK